MTRRPALPLALAMWLAAVSAPVSAGGFDRAIAIVTPRVVKLYGLGAGFQAGYGSGVIVSKDGLVLTVFSLLIDARKVRAVTADGRMHEAKVVCRDRERQLALLQLVGDTTGPAAVDGSTESFQFFDLSHESTLLPGDWIVAAGNPFKIADGAEPVSINHGVFSVETRLDARRRVRDFPYHGRVLVIDAITSNPGAPGAALVNLDGEFVGMIGREVVSNLTNTHFNYAVPRDVLHEFFEEARSPTEGEGGAIGFVGSADPTNAAATGSTDKQKVPVDPGIRLSRLGYRKVLPFVERVRPGSRAQRAGVRKDDLILSLNGRQVSDVADYNERLSTLTHEDPIDLVIRRGRRILTIRLEPEQP